ASEMASIRNRYRRRIRFRSYRCVSSEEADKSHGPAARVNLALNATERCDAYPPFALAGASHASDERCHLATRRIEQSQNCPRNCPRTATDGSAQPGTFGHNRARKGPKFRMNPYGKVRDGMAVFGFVNRWSGVQIPQPAPEIKCRLSSL